MVEAPQLETPFNMAMLYYMGLSKLFDRKTEAMLNNNLELAYECLEEMYTKVYFKLADKEHEVMTNKLDKLKKTIPPFKLPETIQQQVLHNFKNLMRDFDRTIMVYMHKYKMIFPKIRVQGGLEALEKKMGLVK